MVMDDLCRELRRIPELADASVIGEQQEEIAVTIDRERLSAYGTCHDYDAGLATVSELLEAQMEMYSAKASLTDAGIAYRNAVAEYLSKNASR